MMMMIIIIIGAAQAMFGVVFTQAEMIKYVCFYILYYYNNAQIYGKRKKEKDKETEAWDQ